MSKCPKELQKIKLVNNNTDRTVETSSADHCMLIQDLAHFAAFSKLIKNNTAYSYSRASKYTTRPHELLNSILGALCRASILDNITRCLMQKLTNYSKVISLKQNYSKVI